MTVKISEIKCLKTNELSITFVIVVLISVIGFTISVLVGIKTKELLRNQANKKMVHARKKKQ